LFANNRHVSSANSAGLKFDAFGRSFIDCKEQGDRIDPCDKPQVICWIWDLHLFTTVFFSRLCK